MNLNRLLACVIYALVVPAAALANGVGTVEFQRAHSKQPYQCFVHTCFNGDAERNVETLAQIERNDCKPRSASEVCERARENLEAGRQCVAECRQAKCRKWELSSNIGTPKSCLEGYFPY